MSQISFFTELLWLNVQSLKWNKPLMWESRWVSAGQTLAMLGFQNFSFNTSLLSHHRLSYSSSHIQKSAWKPCTVFPQVESRAILISPQTTPPGFISFFISSFFSYNLYKDLLRWFFLIQYVDFSQQHIWYMLPQGGDKLKDFRHRWDSAILPVTLLK